MEKSIFPKWNTLLPAIFVVAGMIRPKEVWLKTFKKNVFFDALWILENTHTCQIMDRWKGQVIEWSYSVCNSL